MRLIFPALLALALAAVPADYAVVAELDLPPEGPALIDLDRAQTLPHRDDLLLLDAEGREVPRVMLGSWQGTRGGCAPLPWDPVGPPPRFSAISVDTRAAGRRLDRLVIDPGPVGGGLARALGDGSFALPLTLEKGEAVLAEGLIWRASIAHARREDLSLDVGGLDPGVYTLRAPDPLRWQGVQGCWSAETDVQPVALEVAVAGPTTDGEGVSRYTIALPAGGLEVVDLRLDVEEARFARAVSLHAPSLGGAPGERLAAGDIERLSLGGATLDHVVVAVDREVPDRLILQIEDGLDAPLTLTGARVRLRNRQLLVHDAGPGPHRLYAAPARARAGRHDLEQAVVELLREAPPRVMPLAFEENPDYNAAAALPAALLRGARAEVGEHRAWREAEAPRAGLPTRWRLPAELVGRARPGLGDLRLVDAEGHQVPYVIEDMGLVRAPARVELVSEPGRSRLVLRFEVPTRVDRVVLRSDAEVFSREVRLDGGPARRWERAPSQGPRALVLEGGPDAVERLTLSIDDGDDQALTGLTAEALTRDLALVAAAPEGGARLYYGAAVGAPDYDLRLLAERLRQGVVQEGRLGSEQRASVSTEQDRRVGLVAVGALAAAMLFMVVRLLGEPKT